MSDSSCCVTTSQKRLMVFSGRSNPELAAKIADIAAATMEQAANAQEVSRAIQGVSAVT